MGLFSELASDFAQPDTPSDPVEWVRHKTGYELWSKQQEILHSVQNNKQTAVQSCHGSGKSMLASLLAAWWIDTHPYDDTIVITTAPSKNQVHGILWENIRKIARDAKLPGEVQLSDNWYVNRMLVGQGRKPQDYNNSVFQGMHREFVLFILDEACHDDQTEVMTEQGWKFFADLDGSEKLLTMSPKTHEAKYVKPQHITKKRYKGRMYLSEVAGSNWCVTPDHDMYYQKKVQINGNVTKKWFKDQARNVLDLNNRAMKKVIDWNVEDVSKHQLPDGRYVEMDDWLEFMGWFMSEGSFQYLNDTAYGIRITQKDPDTLEEIYQICGRLGLWPNLYENVVTVNDVELAQELLKHGRYCLDKRVPQYVRYVSARQLNIFLDAYQRGDGYEKEGQGIIYTSCKGMADDLQELILKTGKPSVVHKRELAGQQNWIIDHWATSSVDGYVVTRPYRESLIKHRPENVTMPMYDGMVYCASVPPDALLFTRRKGYTLWSGNCGISPNLWTAAITNTTSKDCRILAIGNPDDPGSEFARVCQRDPKWNTIKISLWDTPNFTGEPVSERARRNLVDESYLETARTAWGESSPLWASKVDGEFPTVDDFAVIPVDWVHRAFERHQIWLDSPPEPRDEFAGPERKILGVDVARYGKDKSVIATRVGDVFTDIESFTMRDNVELANLVMKRMNKARDKAIIDVNGIGQGVYDIMRRRGYKVEEFIAGAKTTQKDMSRKLEFTRVRSAAWWKLREALDPANAPTISFPDVETKDQELLNELTTPRWEQVLNGQIQVESKDDIRKRLDRSTDYADAVIMAWWAKPHVVNSIEDASFRWIDDNERANEVEDGAFSWNLDDDWRDNSDPSRAFS